MMQRNFWKRGRDRRCPSQAHTASWQPQWLRPVWFPWW